MPLIDSYDFGCAGWDVLLTHFIPALAGALAVLAVMGGFGVVGAFVNRSGRVGAVDILSGWGVAAFVMTLAVVCFSHLLPFVAAAFFLAAIILAFAYPARLSLCGPFIALVLFPGLVILVALNLSGIAKWDDFSHWVPNALYLYAHNGAPGQGMPPVHSVWPGYPYALPFATYLSSMLAGGFLVQGGAMFAFALLILFAAMLVTQGRSVPLPLRARCESSEWEKLRGWSCQPGLGEGALRFPNAPEKIRNTTIAEGPPPYPSPQGGGDSTVLAALALFFVTLGNPGFNASFTLTNQGDGATMIVAGAIALLLWRWLEGGKEPVALMLSFVVLALLKQSNLVLMILLAGGFCLAAWKNNKLRAVLPVLIAIVLPAIVIRFIWQNYVAREMAGNGFGFHPLAEWRFDLLPQLVQAIGATMLKKSGHFGFMLIVTFAGAVSVVRKPSRLGNFLIIAGFAYAGYLAFLFIAYLGSNFNEAEITRAASFYRYSTHLGLLGIAAGWIAAPGLIARWRVPLPVIAQRAGAALITLAMPLALFIKAELVVPQPGTQICERISFARDVAAVLPDHSRLAVIDPEGDGLLPAIMDYRLAMEEAQTGRDLARSSRDNPAATAIIAPKAKTEPIAVDTYDNKDAPLLLVREGAGWKRLSLPPLAVPAQSR